MNDFILKIIPIVVIFFLGYIFKRVRLFAKEDADLLLKVVFNVTLPALTFLSISRVELDTRYLFLPLIAMATVFITYIPARFFGKFLKLEPKTLGVFMIGIMIMNTGFTMPFLIAAFGDEGLAVYTIFDFGNSFLIFTFIYYHAIKYGDFKGHKIPIKKFFNLPPIWGLIGGLVVNFINIKMPLAAINFLEIVGTPTAFLVMLSLGIYFTPRIAEFGKVGLVLFLRIGVGLMLGYCFTLIFNLDGLLRTLVIVFCGAPVGYNTLVFASRENLDKEFAASIVSISLLLGIIYVPILLWVL